jgi:hypothetical protein
MPPGMAQMGEMLAGIKFVEIDYEKVNTIDDLKLIVSTAIPMVVRNSPQYFKILKFIKT